MSYFFNTAFLAALKANETIMNGASVKMVLFPYAPTFVDDEGVADARYAGINSIDTLATTLGWGPYIPQTVTDLIYVNTTAAVPAKYVMMTDPFELPDDFPTTHVRAIAFVYMGPNVPMTNNIIFVTDTPLSGGTVLLATDAVTALPDANPGFTTDKKWLFSWSAEDPAAALSMLEGPLVLFKGPRPFDQAKTQHCWIYPQRINYIANPSFELNDDFWRGNGDVVQTELAFPTARVGTTQNIVLSGLQPIDALNVVAGDRVLVKKQLLPAEHGVYVAATGAWTRATDADSEVDLFNSLVYVKNGSQQGLWRCVTPKPITVGTTSLVYDQFYWGAGNYSGKMTGTAPVIMESNSFPMNLPLKKEEGWTIQALIRSDGEVKVGLLSWEPSFFATATDWGPVEESWHPNDGYIAMRTIRQVGDVTVGMLRLESNGTYLEVDQVCVEPGMFPANKVDWPYFDGSNLFSLPGSFSWYGNPHASYSCFYNNRQAVMGRLFQWGLDPEDQGPGGVITDEETIKWGMVYQWVPAGTPVQEHFDVLYPNDPKTAIPAVTGSPIPYKVDATDKLGVVNPWPA